MVSTRLRITAAVAAFVALGVSSAGSSWANLRIETRIDPYGPYELTREATGIAASLVWRSGTGECGYSSCQSLYSPLEGRTLHFYARNSATELCSAVTDADGKARCGFGKEKLALIQSRGVTVRFEGDETYLPSSVTRTYAGVPLPG